MKMDDLLSQMRSGRLTYLAALLIMIIMPVHYRYLPPLMILLFIGWIMGNYPDFETLKRPSRYRVLLILFLAFYFLQMISIFYTEDLNLGWSNIFGRLSIIVFPLILFSPSEKIRNNSVYLLRIFALSTAVYVLSCFILAVFKSYSYETGVNVFIPHPAEFPWLNYFYSQELTYSIHPSYLAMYVLVSIFISFESFYDNSLKFNFRIWWFILGIALMISIYFISSRAAIIAFILMISLYSAGKILSPGKTKFLWLGIILILIGLLPLIKKNDRINYLIDGLLKENLTLKRQDERLIIWDSVIKLIKENPLVGVGIGDVRNELTIEYLSAGEEHLGNIRMNAHNQFLETMLEVGISGLLILIAIFGYMIFIAVKGKNILYGLFIVMMVVFFMFETVLYRLAGIAFFSLFAFILPLTHQKIKKSE